MAVVISCLLAVMPGVGNAQGFERPEIVATRAIVVDATSGDVLYDKNANLPGPMASLTKLFTAFVAIETTPLDQHMNVSDSDLVGEASMGVSTGEILTFQTLLNGMLLPSGNDAAMAIARNLGAQAGDSDSQATQRFVDRANARLQTLGLHDTHLVNPHGLDADGHVSTARDIAAVTMYALSHEPTFASTIHTAEYEAEGHVITNTNRLLGTYTGLIGGKTGVTDNAGYCLMQVAERDGHRVIAVLLGSTPDAWYDDAELLLDYGFMALATPGAAVTTDRISFATAPAIAVPVSQPVAGLAVTSSGPGTALVSQTAVIDTPRRSPWLWIVTAVVIAPISLLILSQLQRALRGRNDRPVRRHSRHVPVSHLGQVVYTTSIDRQSIASAHRATVEWQHADADFRFDETTEWRVPTAQSEPRRGDRPRNPVFSPSFSGD